MENKYYPPSIEEFHIGFRYEQECLTTTLDLELTTGWFKGVVDDVHDFSHILDNLEDGMIRVKYLDQSDLEELGWEFGSLPGIFNLKHSRMLFNRFRPDEPPFIRIANLQFEVFAGEIKNFNEMKKLMEMLQIV